MKCVILLFCLLLLSLPLAAQDAERSQLQTLQLQVSGQLRLLNSSIENLKELNSDLEMNLSERRRQVEILENSLTESSELLTSYATSLIEQEQLAAKLKKRLTRGLIIVGAFMLLKLIRVLCALIPAAKPVDVFLINTKIGQWVDRII